MTQPETTATTGQTIAHLNGWHRISPPYLGPAEDVHAWLHEDMDRPCDVDHTQLDLRGVRA